MLHENLLKYLDDEASRLSVGFAAPECLPSQPSEEMGGGACTVGGCSCKQFRNGGGGPGFEEFCGNCGHDVSNH